MNLIVKALLRFIGRHTLQIIREAGAMGIYLGKVFFWMFIPPLRFKRTIHRIYFIGVKTVFVILLTGAFAGMVLGLQLYHVLRKFGAEAMLGAGISLILIRELGPVFTALMVTGRAGSSLTAELGIMRISEQIDALDVMALNPLQYLVVPIVLAGIIVFPILTWFFDIIGIWGGYLVGVKLLGIAEGTYFSQIHYVVDPDDILEGLYKSISFGLLVTWICSYKGYYASYGAEGVSKATTEAVVYSSVLILLLDYLIGSLLF